MNSVYTAAFDRHPELGELPSSRPQTQTALERPSFGISGRLIFALTVIGVLILGIGGWAVIAELSGAVVAGGTVVIDKSVKKVQHRDGGIVSAIKVKNGDEVKEGDLLIQLDGTQVGAELGVVRSQHIELSGRMARLIAERDGLPEIQFPTVYKSRPGADKVMAGEVRLFNESRQSRNGQRQQLEERISQLKQELKGYDVQRDAKEHELILIRKELAKVRDLFEKRITPETRVYALEREETRLDGERGNLIAQGARVGGQISEIRVQILTLEQTTRTDAQRELLTVLARLSELGEKESALIDKQSRLDIRAPVAGKVHELNIHTVVGIAASGDQLAVIVPYKDSLAIELRIPPTEIDRIHLDQGVRLRFTSFNQRTTPELDGRITYIAADISHDPKAKQDFYPVRALLENDEMRSIAGRPILPGMPTEAYIITEKRSALSYFLKPITDQVSRTFREP